MEKLSEILKKFFADDKAIVSFVENIDKKLTPDDLAALQGALETLGTIENLPDAAKKAIATLAGLAKAKEEKAAPAPAAAAAPAAKPEENQDAEMKALKAEVQKSKDDIGALKTTLDSVAGKVDSIVKSFEKFVNVTPAAPATDPFRKALKK